MSNRSGHDRTGNREEDAPPISTTVSLTAVPALERLSASVITLLNARNTTTDSSQFQELLRNIDTKWEARLQGQPYTLSFDDALSLWHEHIEQAPTHQMKLLEAGSHLRERGTAAHVYLYVKELGVSAVGASKYYFLELKWKYIDGQWLCTRLTTMDKPCSDSGILC